MCVSECVKKRVMFMCFTEHVCVCVYRCLRCKWSVRYLVCCIFGSVLYIIIFLVKILYSTVVLCLMCNDSLWYYGSVTLTKGQDHLNEIIRCCVRASSTVTLLDHPLQKCIEDSWT